MMIIACFGGAATIFTGLMPGFSGSGSSEVQIFAGAAGAHPKIFAGLCHPASDLKVGALVWRKV